MKESKKFSTGLLMPVLLLLGLLLLYVLFLFLTGKKTTAAQVIKAQDKEPDNDNADSDRVLKAIQSVNPGVDPLHLLSIAAHETGEFTSNVFLNNNNMFGMRHPKERDTTSQGDKGGYAYYNSIEDSVRDFVLWLKARNVVPGTSLSDLIQSMKNNDYMEASYNSYNKACVAFLNYYKQVYE